MSLAALMAAEKAFHWVAHLAGMSAALLDMTRAAQTAVPLAAGLADRLVALTVDKWARMLADWMVDHSAAHSAAS